MNSGIADTLHPAHVKTTFATGSAGYPLSKQANFNAGADIGFTHFGLSRFGIRAGMSYNLRPVPLTLNLNTRYSTYRLEGYSGETRADGSSANIDGRTQDPMAWRNLLSGSIDLIWRFRVKMKDR
jgi:hypothetical protein